MAGTDHTRGALRPTGPRIVLVEPQLPENIGATARAMLNCGLTDLALVKPRDRWPNDKAVAMSSGATAVLDGAGLFGSTEAAVADLQQIYAATARPRDLTKRVVTPRQAGQEIRQAVAAGQRVGVLFGPERSGLTNDDMVLAKTVITVPLNPSYASLNLAQAVLLVAYEWFQAGDDTPPESLIMNGSEPATMTELGNLLARVEAELDQAGFFRNEDIRPSIARNLRNLFHRLALTEQEVRTLHGVLSSLISTRHKR